MRNVLTALALSTLFAAAPALAAHKNVAKPAKTAAVTGDAKAPEGEAKTEAPADKGTKKKVKKPKSTKTEKSEAAPPAAEAPAK